ncbi:MAG TPA: hypothetical protein VLX31_16100 [Streptosporangiaceae bacterium]|nr:hypothetical protein [Streptosporangiaceae bacterium]
MQIPDLHVNTTAFLCVEQDGGAEARPRATAFFVIDRSGSEPHPVWAVTGRHCVENARATGRQVYLRVNTRDSYVDVPTDPDDWYVSDEADVAAARWLGPSECTVTSVPLDQFIDEDFRYRGANDFPMPAELVKAGGQLVQVGHEVFFVGLFSQHAGKRRNLPIVRFGNISRPPLEPVAVRLSDDPADESVTDIHGYLVEARSWGGHSGSPAFWYWPGVQATFIPDPRVKSMTRNERRRLNLSGDSQIPVSREFGVLALLGLVSAHFDIEQEARTLGDVVGKIFLGVNAGIAVVTPAHYIRRLIEREDVVEDGARYNGRPSPELAATFDVYGAIGSAGGNS